MRDRRESRDRDIASIRKVRLSLSDLRSWEYNAHK
jgi:hypothetical protein